MKLYPKVLNSKTKEDAENEPMPKMIKKVKWNEIKNFLIKEVKKLI